MRVTVHVQDGLSGVRQIAYRTDGGAVFDGGTPIADGGSFLVTTPGASVKVGAIDNVGNRSDSLATAGASGAPAPANLTWNYATDFQDQSNPGPALYGNPSVWSECRCVRNTRESDVAVRAGTPAALAAAARRTTPTPASTR